MDGWKVIDLLIKGIGAALITGFVAFYGHRLQQIEVDKADQMKRVTELVDITSKQKELDVNLAMQMFGKLLSDYLKPLNVANQSAELEGRLLMLRLIAVNFQDVPVNLKPLFEQLDGQLANMPPPAEKLRAKLRDIAQEVARRQAFRMTLEEGYDSDEMEVRPGDTKEFLQYHVKIDIEEINLDGVKLTMTTSNGKVGPFTASYFDSPLVDNVKIDLDNRGAILLINSGKESARIRFIGFPSDLASDRFDIKEIARRLNTDFTISEEHTDED